MEKRGDKECGSISKESLQTDALPERAKLPQQDLLLRRGGVASSGEPRPAAVRPTLRPFPVLREHQLREAIEMRKRRRDLCAAEAQRERRGVQQAHAVELDRY